MRRTFSIFVFLCALFVSPLLNLLENADAQVPQSLNPGSQYVKAKLIADQSNVQPASTENAPSGRIGILLTIEPGWHTYWQNSGEAALPTKVDWQVPSGWRVGPLNWPMPLRVAEKGNITTFGYTKETMLWSEIFAPQIVPSEGEKVKISATVKFLVCKDICVPGKQSVELELPFSSSLAQQASENEALFEKYVAESPKPMTLALTHAMLRNINATGMIATKTAAPDSTVTAGILLQGLAIPEGADVAGGLQIFPYNNPALSTKAPTAVVIPGERGKDILITFPIILRSSAPLGATSLQGVLAITPSVSQGATNIVTEWTVPIEISPETPPAENTDFPKTTVPGETLRYHTAIFAEPAKEGNIHGADSTTSKPAEPFSFGALLIALVTAFVGGLILNLMPCVLPIISIKILGFVGQKDQSRKSALVSSLFFSAGILTTFLSLALTIIVLRSLGKELAWGFQFHHPGFVFGLMLVVFFLSLALFELYSFQLPFLNSANKAASSVNSPHLKHFFDGVLATALSTPCTAPIFGTALAFAFAQPPPVTILVFLAIGSGLAFPYILLSTNPRLMKLVPAPGDWMFRFRALMGFFLLGTVVWLLGILQSLNADSPVWAVLLLLIIFFAVWYRRSLRESGTEPRVMRTKTIPLVLMVMVSFYCLTPKILGQHEKQQIAWEAFTPELMSQAPQKGKTLFIDFTAAWCVTCKFNEYFILSRSDVVDALKQYNITPVKADWTNGDEAITEALRSFGAEGVPFYAVIPASGGEAIKLSTLPSSSSLIEAFQKASAKK